MLHKEMRFKTIAEVIEAAAVVELGVPPAFVSPERDPLAARLNWDPALKWPNQRHELERRLIGERMEGAADLPDRLTRMEARSRHSPPSTSPAEVPISAPAARTIPRPRRPTVPSAGEVSAAMSWP